MIDLWEHAVAGRELTTPELATLAGISRQAAWQRLRRRGYAGSHGKGRAPQYHEPASYLAAFPEIRREVEALRARGADLDASAGE